MKWFDLTQYQGVVSRKPRRGQENPSRVRTPDVSAAGLRRDRPIEVGGVVVRLTPDRRAALGAHVVVLVPAREHEEELLPGRRRPPAPWAEETRGLELFEAVPASHRQEFYTRLEGDRSSEPRRPGGGLDDRQRAHARARRHGIRCLARARVEERLELAPSRLLA